MQSIAHLFTRFHAKLTLALIASMLLVSAFSDLLIYEYSAKNQFEQLRSKLTIIAQTASLAIDVDALLKVPLTRDGVKSSEYKAIADKLAFIKKQIPSLSYIYTVFPTKEKGIFRFIVDPDPEASSPTDATSFPGDLYDGRSLPEMWNALNAPSADRKLGRDEWGIVLSGYAPIRDKTGRTVAILGVDIKADDVNAIQGEVRRRAILVLIVAMALSVVLGFVIANNVTKPIRILIGGARRIAKGELAFKVNVRGNDEIAELAHAFNKMSSDLLIHIEELKRTTTEKERLLKELEIAKKIQQSFLPESAPEMAGFGIAAVTLPARVVGGDFYDFVPIDKNRWGIAVADVSGKGIPAALFMALSRTVLRASIIGNESIADAIAQTNRLIMEDSKTNLFVTLFYAVLNASESSLTFVNAGHNPPLLIGGKSGDVVFLRAQGIPLGLVADIKIATDTISLKKGDVVAIYTDGVPEAQNVAGEQFDMDRLLRVISENRMLSPEDIIKKTREALEKFVGDAPQFDDITLMVLKAL